MVVTAIALGVLTTDGYACSFSQEHQQKVRASVLTRYPGGTTTQTGELRWISPDKLMFFTYGGCEDLGSAAWETRQVDAPLSDESAFGVALRLAEHFWTKDLIGADSQALAILRNGIMKKAWTTKRSNGETHFEFAHPSYVALGITHTYDKGWDTVGIEWQGNF